MNCLLKKYAKIKGEGLLLPLSIFMIGTAALLYEVLVQLVNFLF